MAKQTIAVDLDDVLAAEKEGVRLFINKTYGQNHSEYDYRQEGPYWGYWEHVWGVDDKQGKEWHEAYESSDAKRLLQAIEGSARAVQELKKRYKLVVVTSRNDRHMDETHAWLDKHFPATFDGVEFVAVWSGDRTATKATICKAIGASYLIDDNLDHCTLSAEAGLKCLLFGEYGWNKTDKLPENIVRAKDWVAVLEYFDAAS